MALTLKVEQRLESVGLVALFSKDPSPWSDAATHSYDFIQTNFPKHATIRRDDIAKTLVPIIEVNKVLKNFLAQKKLTQKYWITDFSDLIIDRVWDTIIKVKP